MEEEMIALIKGIILGIGILGFGGILIGTSWIPGVVLLSISVISFVITKEVWSHNE